MTEANDFTQAVGSLYKDYSATFTTVAIPATSLACLYQHLVVALYLEVFPKI